jgi:hypothetical protein
MGSGRDFRASALDQRAFSLAAALTCLACACVSEHSDGNEASGGPDATLPTSAGDAYRTLIAADWEVPPNAEMYLCARLTVSEVTYVNAFRPLNPLGTHHTVLSFLDEPNAPDGVTTCSFGEFGPHGLSGSGVGTDDATLPDGVAVKLERGNQLLLNLHLFNISDAPLRGRSGSQVKTLEAKQVRQLAEGVFAGPLDFTLPPGRSTQSGSCTFEHDATIFDIGPHMHQLGTHIKIVAQTSLQGTVLLHDADFDFDSQHHYPVDMLEMKAGDLIRVECTYENTTQRTIFSGSSSQAEMCEAFISRFPAHSDSLSLCAM